MSNNIVIKSELSDEKPHFCAKCERLIRDRYFLKALNLFWHEDCLKCGCCNCRLGDVGATLYTRENFLLCKSDYMRLYGNTGLCSACNKLIPAFEMVMRAKRNVYHLECFACQQCAHRFCVGDRFYLYENRILCESDYSEKLRYAAAISAEPTSNAGGGPVSSFEHNINAHPNGNQPKQALQVGHQQQQQLQQLHKSAAMANTIHHDHGGHTSIANLSLKSLTEFGLLGMRSGGSVTTVSNAVIDHNVGVH